MKLTNSTVKNKSAPLFYDKVGKHILTWLDNNKKIHEKPGSQKELSAILRQQFNYKVTSSQISRYISGENEMPARIVNALVDHLGFKSQIFSDYYVSARDKVQLDHLTKEDLYKLIAEQTMIIKEWKDIGTFYGERLTKFIDDNHQLVLGMKKMVEDYNKQQDTIRELRRKIKELETAAN